METDSPFDASPLEFLVSLPQPVRILFYFTLASLLAMSLYIWVQAAMMIYDFYQALEWAGELADHA